MAILKATVRFRNKSGLYPVYIRFTQVKQVSYVKTSWMVNDKGINERKEIIDPFVIKQTSLLIENYYTQLNKVDSSNWSVGEIVLYDGEDVTILQLLHFCNSEMVAVCYILDVSADDRSRYAKYLFAFRVKLKEALASDFIANLVALQMTDNRFSCEEILFLLLVEEFQIKLIELWIEEHVNATFGCSHKAESGSCLDFLTIVGCYVNWQNG